jgi:hypothetical protein
MMADFQEAIAKHGAGTATAASFLEAVARHAFDDRIVELRADDEEATQ